MNLWLERRKMTAVQRAVMGRQREEDAKKELDMANHHANSQDADTSGCDQLNR